MWLIRESGYNRGVKVKPKPMRERSPVRIYRRHQKGCPYTSERENRCQCPIHVEGRIGEELIKRRSLHTDDWETANQTVRDWITSGTTRRTTRITLAAAVEAYLADMVTRVEPSTVFKTRKLLEQLQAFADKRGITFLNELGVAELREFRASWKTWGPLTQIKHIDRMRSFINWAAENEWTKRYRERPLSIPSLHRRMFPFLPMRSWRKSTRPLVGQSCGRSFSFFNTPASESRTPSAFASRTSKTEN